MLPKYAPGEKIPGTPYVVAHRIGRGGMGDVLAVRDEHLDVLRAVKLLDLEPRPGQKRADAVTEVLKEAVVIAKLHKLCREHIVEVLFVGQTADANQIPFIVMELIDGAPLRDLLKRRGGRLEPVHARQVGVDVLAALAAAHDQGIVHRDLKPANIMCEMLDQNRVRMKVIDFGIVGGINQRTKRIAGTFRYAAPEQIHISGPSPLMAQTDLYALGCILYECLAGQGPFDSYCKTNEHYVHAHLTAEAPPISTYVPGIPRAFDAFFASILAKDVALRPASARACAAQLMDLPWDYSGDQDVTKTEEMLEAAIQSVVANHEAGRGAPAPNAQATARSPGHSASPQGDLPPQHARNMQSQAAPTPRMPGAPGAPAATLMSPRGGTVRVDHMAMTLPIDGAAHAGASGPHDGPTRTSSPLVRPAPKNETDPLPDDYPNASVPAPSTWGMGGVYAPPSNRDGDSRDASTFGAVMRSLQLTQISPSALRIAIAACVLGAAALCVALGVVLAHHHGSAEVAAAAAPMQSATALSAAASAAPVATSGSLPDIGSAVAPTAAAVASVAETAAAPALATTAAPVATTTSTAPTRAHTTSHASDSTSSNAAISAGSSSAGAAKPRKLPGSGL